MFGPSVGCLFLTYQRTSPKTAAISRHESPALPSSLLYCSTLRYAVAGDPLNTAICHCKGCQRQTGSAFSIVVAVPRGSLSMDGSVATYEITGDNGAITRRYFCAKCGSPIAIDPATIPAVTFLSVGTLDETSWVKPQAQLWCESAQSWVHLSDETRNFPRGMTA
jgi:hypothetical protein